MPKGPKGETRPADVIGNAVHVMKIATGEVEDDPKDASAGRSKGGKARARKLSPEKRREIARKAAESRWGERTGTTYASGDQDDVVASGDMLETLEYVETLIPDDADPVHRKRLEALRDYLSRLWLIR